MGGGGQTTSQTTTQELSPEQRALLEPVIPIAQDYLKNPPKQYPGSAIVKPNPLQLQAQQMTLNAANSLTPVAQGGLQALGSFQGATPGGVQQLQQGQSGLLAGGMGVLGNQIGAQNRLLNGSMLDPNQNPALAGVTEAAIRPIIQNFQEQIMPGITQQAVADGGFGGTRQGIAEGIAGRGALNAIGDTSANIQNNAYNQGLQAMAQLAASGPAASQFAQVNGGLDALTNGLALSPSIMNSSLMPAQLTATVGEQQNAFNQAQLNEKIQKYVNKQLIPFSTAQDVAALAFGIPAGSSTTTGQVSGGGGGGMQALQTGMGMLSMLPMLFSDSRLKRNVTKVGERIDGLGIYVYNLLDETFATLGLLAEEVLGVYPQAVAIGVDGYARVNYAAIPDWYE